MLIIKIFDHKIKLGLIYKLINFAETQFIINLQLKHIMYYIYSNIFISIVLLK